MSAELLFGALALMLVLEGVLPLVNPKAWRAVFERAVRMTDGQLRFLGLCSLGAGLLMLALVLD